MLMWQVIKIHASGHKLISVVGQEKKIILKIVGFVSRV